MKNPFNSTVLAVLLALCTGSGAVHASDVDPWSLTYAGMDRFYNLEYEEAIDFYQQALQLEPENVRILSLLANAYLFQELYRLEQLDGNLYSSSNSFLKTKELKPDKAQIKLIQDTLSKIRSLSQARLREDPEDVEALYGLGSSYSLEGIMTFTIQKKFMAALRASTKANNLHEKVLELDPDFHDAKLVTGTYQYVVGSLPWAVKVLAFFIGHRGNKAKGVRLIHDAMTKGTLTGSAAAVVLALGYDREKKYAYARQLLVKLTEYYPRNYLYRLEVGKSFRREGNRSEALRVFRDVTHRIETGAPGYGKAPLGRIYFEIGIMEQGAGRLEEALLAFNHALSAPGSKDQLRTHARLRRGSIFLSLDRPEQARAELEIVASTGFAKPRRQARSLLRKMKR